MITLPIATLSEALEKIPFILIGFTLVMVVLSLLWFMTFITSLFFKQKTVTTAPVQTISTPVADISGKLDPRIVAVISAAVHTALDGKSFNVVSISPASGTWSAEGRRQIFASHRLR
jgi:Na+-transporting methylmalonyl-CoA/oxaloacetate decarboxylase gamma subunit